LKGSKNNDSAVSEVIGYILVFAIVFSLLSAVVAVYVPDQGKSSELAYQSQTESTMSSFMSSIITSEYSPIGTTFSQNFPMGIKGEFFSGTQDTSLGYNYNGLQATLSYNVSVGYNYPSSTPIDLINNTILTNISIGSKPMALALDTQNDNIYALNYYGGSIYVINSTNNKCQVIKNVFPLDAYAIGAAYDPVNDVLYVALQSGNTSLNGIAEYHISTNVTTYFPIANIPYDVAYEPATGNIYFTTYYNLSQNQPGPPPPPGSTIGGGIVYALNATQNVIIGATYVPGYISGQGPGPPHPPGQKVNNDSIYPTGIAYDPSNGLLYVDDHNGTNLYGINPVTDQVSYSNSNIQAPWSQAFDSASGVIYVTQSQISTLPPPPPGPGPHPGPGPGPGPAPPPKGDINQVSMINSSNNKCIGTITYPFSSGNGAAPAGIVYDNSNHLLYVAGFSSGDIYILDGVNNTYTGKFLSLGINSEPGYGPNSMLFDPYNGYVYVADFGSGNISVIDGSTVLKNSISFTGSNLPTNDKLHAFGEIFAYGPTNFITPYNFTMEDGTVVSQAFNTNSEGSVTGTPVSLNGSSNSISLSADIMSFLGYNSSIGSSSPQLINMVLDNVSSLALSVGKTFNIGNYSSTLIQGVITALVTFITVQSFNYIIKSSAAGIISTALYHLYNNTTGNAPANWVFSNFPLHASLSGNTLTISLIPHAVLHVQYLLLRYFVVNSGL
jgi:DNA-binding beta-propeller fold protein YncE